MGHSQNSTQMRLVIRKCVTLKLLYIYIYFFIVNLSKSQTIIIIFFFLCRNNIYLDQVSAQWTLKMQKVKQILKKNNNHKIIRTFSPLKTNFLFKLNERTSAKKKRIFSLINRREEKHKIK